MPRQAIEQLPIRRIAALTGVKAMTLRAWERRYGLIRPQRTAGGHRLYTHAHVERIRRVLSLLERGVPVGRVRDLLDAEPARVDQHGPWLAYRDRMAAAIARFDEPELDRIHDEALSLHPVEQLTRHLYLPLLEYLGDRWQALAGGVAEEHFFAMYLRSKLGARLQRRMRYADGPRLLCACAPGEQHEIGLLLFALEAHDAGLRTVLLGADTPAQELAIACERSACDAIVISSSYDSGAAFLGDDLPTLVRAARMPVFVGGRTAERQRAAIVAAGALALGPTLEDGVREISRVLRGRGGPS